MGLPLCPSFWGCPLSQQRDERSFSWFQFPDMIHTQHIGITAARHESTCEHKRQGMASGKFQAGCGGRRYPQQGAIPAGTVVVGVPVQPSVASKRIADGKGMPRLQGDHPNSTKVRPGGDRPVTAVPERLLYGLIQLSCRPDTLRAPSWGEMARLLGVESPGDPCERKGGRNNRDPQGSPGVHPGGGEGNSYSREEPPGGARPLTPRNAASTAFASRERVSNCTPLW